jgi:D-arabinose 1-dehydrogenase-like Zn-dependent alcohol dehydrogenase
MKSTYRAMQVTTPGTLELVERETPTPGQGEVLIAVEACGICGADAADIEGADPSLRPPRVPGHEVVGRIVAIGPAVPSIWTVGQRVGVGRLGGHCNEKALSFCVLTDARPWIETMRLQDAAAAYRRMQSGDVKFRMVLTLGED